MVPEFLFYFHVILTGVVIAAASYSFAGMIGAPAPMIVPVVNDRAGPGMAVLLWLLSGPVALLRSATSGLLSRGPWPLLSLAALSFAAIWAFALGVAVLELAFRLLNG